MEIIREAPRIDDFVPLAEHQSTTPASFYTGPTVLHYQNENCKLRITDYDLRTSEALSGLVGENASSSSTAGVNGNANGTEPYLERVFDSIQVWVASSKLFLYSTKMSTGVSIPYPSVSLHAIQSLPQPSEREQQGLYMQLTIPSPNQPTNAEDEEPESVSLTLVPPPPTSPPAAENIDDGPPPVPPTQALFNALSDCSNLHPDPVSDDDDEENISESTLFQRGLIAPGASGGGLPPPMPGSGGWITAENVNEYFDEDGNWIGGEDEEGHENVELGPGAGIVRARDEADGNGEGEVDGGDDETKWQRTS